jgi:RNA polymerase sigma-70 factor (ECF subfamily)
MSEPAAASDRFGSLMRSAQDGDAEAYAELMRELTPRVRRIVRRQRGFLPKEDIEDLVQDVLLSVHTVRATYDPARPFIPWLIAIARNRLVDQVRRHVRGAAHEVAVEDLAVTFSEPIANLPSGTFQDPEALHQAIEQLPPGQRSAIELLKLREMSLKETSAATGTSIGALKVATHRAMIALRKRLVDMNGRSAKARVKARSVNERSADGSEH